MNDCFCVNNYRCKCKYKENIKDMSDDRKRILSPFTGCKKRKAWNKIREKYIKIERKQNLVETDRGSYYKEEQLEEFFDSEGAFYNVNKSDNDDDQPNKSDNDYFFKINGSRDFNFC